MLLLARQMACAGGLWGLLSADYAGIPDGTRALVAAMADDAGAEIRLGAPVSAVHAAGADAVEVHLVDGGTLRAQAAVLTPPLNALRAIDLGDALGPATRRGVQAGTANVGAKYWALVRGAPGDFHALGPAGGIDVASTWRSVDAGEVIVAFGRSAAALDGDDPAAVQAALRHYLPEVEVLESTWYDWSSDEWTGGTWGGWRPGWATGGMLDLLRPTGRVVIAGSETAESWPGFMEGAIDSGARAARTVAGLLLAEAAA
jgi:monoamine oxidase